MLVHATAQCACLLDMVTSVRLLAGLAAGTVAELSSAHWICGADDGAIAQRLNGGEPVAQPQHAAQPPAAA